jgi:hypothetical protein
MYIFAQKPYGMYWIVRQSLSEPYIRSWSNPSHIKRTQITCMSYTGKCISVHMLMQQVRMRLTLPKYCFWLILQYNQSVFSHPAHRTIVKRRNNCRHCWIACQSNFLLCTWQSVNSRILVVGSKSNTVVVCPYGESRNGCSGCQNQIHVLYWHILLYVS